MKKEVNADRSTRMSLPSATSTWRSAANLRRGPVQITVHHLEKEQQLENALDEYCELREKDRSLTASRFCERYPSYRHSLRRLIDVHEAMEGQPALEEENWPELFTEFLGYEILHELGVGAIARVYLATEVALGGRLVAIKVAQEGGDEAETLGKLTHPNIVPVFSVKHDEETDLTAVCMPYHGSATLADLLELGFERGAPPTKASVILDAAREREQVVDFVERRTGSRRIPAVLLRGNYVDGIVRLGVQMAEALAYTHERGILHRDLKPSNVLLTPDGVPMLLDFNLASDIETGAPRLGGTLPYMPPEQIRDVHLQPFEAGLTGDPRSDIFSLAVILYELLTGKLPFGDPPACVNPRQAAEEFLAAQQRPPRPVRELNPAVSSKFAELLHKCLALEPSQRPESAADLVGQLKKYFSPRRRVQRWTARHRGLVTSLVLLFMLMASTATWHLATRPAYPLRQYAAALADIERGWYSNAIEHLDQALAQRECGAFRFLRGVTHQRLGEHEVAVADLTKAAEAIESPLVLECLAYSQLHSPNNRERGKARKWYGDLEEMLAELEKKELIAGLEKMIAAFETMSPELETMIPEFEAILAELETMSPELQQMVAEVQKTGTEPEKLAPELEKIVAELTRTSLLSPELELNWAFALLQGKPAPSPASGKASDAINRMRVAKPDWQQAYYVRALAYCRWAEQLLPSGTSGRYVKTISDSIRDFEQALSIEPVSQHLRLDAARAYALRDQDAPSEEFIELLNTTVDHGLSRPSLESLAVGYSWVNADWYRELLEECDTTATPPRIDNEYFDYFLTPPDYQAVKRYFLETEPILAE